MKTHVVLWLCFLGCIINLSGLAQTNTLGFQWEENGYRNFPVKAPISMKESLPTRISYEKYVPSIANQGNYNTGVAFAVGYYLYGIINAVQTQKDPQSTVFSPSYIYEKSKSLNDTECKEGIAPETALLTLLNTGIVPYKQMPYPSCGQSTIGLDTEAGKNKIREAVRLFAPHDIPGNKILYAKKALSEGTPIIIVMPLFHSFEQSRKSSWTPSKNEISNRHQALCVIGYDNNKYGGAFRVVNSLGNEWADNGFCWIRYRDFGRFVLSGFQAFPSLSVSGYPTDVSSFIMKTTVEFKLNDGAVMPVRSTQLINKGTFVTDDASKNPVGIMVYRMTEPYRSGASFKMHIHNSQTAYLYALGTDVTLRMSRLVPYDDHTGVVLGPNTTLIFPSETKSITLDTTPGDDYIMLLFSQNPLPFKEILEQLERSSGNFSERAVKVLGTGLIPMQQINYSINTAEFELKQPVQNKIIPLLIQIKHID